MLNNFINKELKSVYGLFFFEKKPIANKYDFSDIIEIIFIFENNILSLKCDNVGIGLKIDNMYQLEDVEMLELGLFYRMDISNIGIFRNLINTYLNNVEKIISDGCEIGMILYFSYDNVSVLNMGDVLVIN